MANLTSQLYEALATVLAEVEAWPGVNQDPNAAYPLVTYNAVGDSDAITNGAKSFSSETESFVIQVSVFDDQQDITRLIQTQASVEALMKDRTAWEATNADVISCKYVGGYGPVYVGSQKYWMYHKTFKITLGKDAGESDIESGS